MSHTIRALSYSSVFKYKAARVSSNWQFAGQDSSKLLHSSAAASYLKKRKMAEHLCKHDLQQSCLIMQPYLSRSWCRAIMFVYSGRQTSTLSPLVRLSSVQAFTASTKNITTWTKQPLVDYAAITLKSSRKRKTLAFTHPSSFSSSLNPDIYPNEVLQGSPNFYPFIYHLTFC